MVRRASVCLVALLLSGLLLAAQTEAQQRRPASFSQLDLSVNGTENVNRVGMHLRWKASTGGGVRVATPFHAGFLEAGARYVPLEALTTEVPSYSAMLFYGGWGLDWGPWRPIRISAGVRAGILRMKFDEVTSFAGVATESELSAGGAVRLELFPIRRIGLFAEASYERTFTAIPIDWVHASVGITARLTTPEWLRKVIE